MGNVLVAGGAGFLGSHLCEALLDDGHRVVAVDNLSSGVVENFAGFADHDRFSFDQLDVTEPLPVSTEFDWVLHLASLASPVFYRERPIETLEAGSYGTHHTLEVARETGASYLFTSTSEVYGDPEINPQPEDYRGNVDPYGPRSCYDESKRYGEALVRAYRERHGVDVRVARLFNTYGPRMRLDDGRAVPTFVRQALAGEDLTVHGDGEQTRSFGYVDDTVRGLQSLMRSDLQEPVNIGNPDERTILDLAELVIDLTDSDSGITYESRPPQDPAVRRPDISRARERLDWVPEVSLERGLQRTIDYAANRLEGTGR